jgi:hypothetical protein
MRSPVLAITFLVLAAGCQSSGGGGGSGEGGPAPTPGPQQPPPVVVPKPDVTLDADSAMLAPIRYQNLTVIPIVATSKTDDEVYLTLDQGMAEKLVSVSELDENGNVNELRISNKSKMPLFVMSGEVIVGGKQDRIIGRNAIVPANVTQTIPVFCVEHGRWSGRRAEFKSANALAHAGLREKATFEDQGKVWSEVSTKNAKRRTTNGTDTYRDIAGQQTAAPPAAGAAETGATGTIASWDVELTARLAEVPPQERVRMVGFAVALNGEVVAVDQFDSPQLFAALSPKILRSYITEAIDDPVLPGAPVVAAADVRAFLAELAAAPAQKVYDTDDSETVHRKSGAVGDTTVRSKHKGAKDKPLFKSAQKSRSSK